MRETDVARYRLRSSGLTGRSIGRPADVVRRHGAMQSQDYGPASWSIGQRARGLAQEDVDRALEDGSIVRTHVLRPTWHFVARDDLRWLLALTGPRVQRGSARRYRELGLDPRTLGRCESAIRSALEGGRHHTRKEIADVLDRARIDAAGQRLPWILMHCELEAVIASGPREGRNHSYALVDERVPPAPRFDRAEALTELVRRYLASHGPASVRDLGWWASLTTADVRAALDGLGSEVVAETVEGVALWWMASDTHRAPSARGVHLLQAYDEIVVGYTESRYLGDPRREAANAAWRDRNVPNGLVLVNGQIGGRWRRTRDGDGIEVEVLLHDDLGDADARALESEVRRLSRFVGLEASLRSTRMPL